MKHSKNGRSGLAAGIVLPILVILFFSASTLLYLVVSSSRKTTGYIHKQRAIDLAQAGTQDALFWFRRQPTLPVTDFDPGDLDSEDPTMGIVRTVEIDERNVVTGIYIVERNLSHDLTAERGEIGAGWIWKISSRGVVFRQVDPEKSFDEPPNQIIEQVRVQTEIRMLNITPTVEAAIVVDKGRNLTCDSRSMILGGNPGSGLIGICYKRNGTPVIRSGADIRGDPTYQQYSDLKLTCRDVFGVDQGSLRNLADYMSENGADDLPIDLPDFSLIYVQGDITFTFAHPLGGGGILFVDGDLTLATGSTSSFEGLVFVTGRIDMRPPSWIEGQIIAVGGGAIGTGGYDKASAIYNKDVLNLVCQLIGNYRMKRTYSIEPVS